MPTVEPSRAGVLLEALGARALTPASESSAIRARAGRGFPGHPWLGRAFGDAEGVLR